MIIKHSVIGSPETTFHNFQISTNGMNLVIPPAKYTNKNMDLFTSGEEVIVPILTPTEAIHYELWITEEGFALRSRIDSQEFGDLVNSLDKLAWFTLPAYYTTLDEVEIHVVEVI